MAEYIEKDALVAWIEKQKRLAKINTIMAIQETPAADVAPVVHGRWGPHMSMVRTPFAMNYDCSVCGSEGFGATNYCPDCGSRMEGVNEDG